MPEPRAWTTLPQYEDWAGAVSAMLHHDWLYQPLIGRLPTIRKTQFEGDGEFPTDIIKELYVMVSYDMLSDEDVMEALTDVAKSCSEPEWRKLYRPLFKGTLVIDTPHPVRAPLSKTRTTPKAFPDRGVIKEGVWMLEPFYGGQRVAAVFSGGTVLFFDETTGKRYRDPELLEVMRPFRFDDQIVFGTSIGRLFIADEVTPLDPGTTKYDTGTMRTFLEDGFDETDRTCLTHAEDFEGTEGDLLGLVYQMKDAGHHGVLLRSDAGCFLVD